MTKANLVFTVDVEGNTIKVFNPPPKTKTYFLYINDEIHLKIYNKLTKTFIDRLIYDSNGKRTLDHTFKRFNTLKKDGMYVYTCDTPESYYSDLSNF